MVGLSYPAHREGAGDLYTNFLQQLERDPEKQKGLSLPQQSQPARWRQQAADPGKRCWLWKLVGHALHGKGTWAGHRPVRTRMCWPRKRGLDPDAGKGNGDEGEGRVKRFLGNRMDRAWGPETVRVREEVETRAALGFLAWETG